MNISFGTGTGNFLSMGSKVKRQKFGIGSFLLLVLVGLAFTGGGYLLYKSSQIDPSWKRIEGTVQSYATNRSTGSSSSSTTYDAIVGYSVDGQSYSVRSVVGSSTIPPVGSSRQVAYDPQSPSRAKLIYGTGAKVTGIILPVIGVLILIAAPVLLMRSRHRSSAITNLQQSGLKIHGVITDIRANGGTNNAVSLGNNYNNGYNNTPPTYKIVVSATDMSGTVQEYVSDTLTGIGGLAMADFRTNPVPIDVYVNQANPKEYYVDVSEVPNLTPERIKQMITNAVGEHSIAPLANQATPPIAAPSPAAQPVQPIQPPMPAQPTAPTPPNPAPPMPPTPPINPIQ